MPDTLARSELQGMNYSITLLEQLYKNDTSIKWFYWWKKEAQWSSVT
jgi:hypothetical protein